jgi:valyl-tRNA synthetase
MGRIEGYRNFCNKIWNATRYVLQNTEGEDSSAGGELSLTDRWISSRLQQVTGEVSRHIEAYRFDLASKELYEFIWNDYCDWYIELSKPVLYSDSASTEQKRAARHILLKVLEAIFRLLHPIMPFITEELWQKVSPLLGIEGVTIMLQAYPEADPSKIDQAAVDELNWVKAFIMGIRSIRSEMDIKPGKPLPLLLQNGSDQDQQRLQNNEAFLMSLARLESITWLNTDENAPESATALVGDMKLLIPLAGLIDKEAELARLQKNIDKLLAETQRLQGKLGNEKFINNAPADVVEKEREKLADAESALNSLQAQADKIRAL